MNIKYKLPSFLVNILEETNYKKWLERKSRAHVIRDRKRGNNNAIIEEYKEAIHKAVIESNGFDCYTNEPLDWSLISTYRNEESSIKKREYKKTFRLLPTVDHITVGQGTPVFKICAWATNDAKNDLDFEDFVKLCNKVVEFYNQKK